MLRCQLNAREIIARALEETERLGNSPDEPPARDLVAAHVLNTVTNEMVEFDIVNRLRAIRNEFSLSPPFESQKAKDALAEVAVMLAEIDDLDAKLRAKANLRIDA